MVIKKLSLSEFKILKEYGLVVPWNVKAQVSKEYKIVNPEDPEDYVIALCTQNMPVAFKTSIYMDMENEEVLDCSGSMEVDDINKTSSLLIKQPKALM